MKAGCSQPLSSTRCFCRTLFAPVIRHRQGCVPNTLGIEQPTRETQVPAHAAHGHPLGPWAEASVARGESALPARLGWRGIREELPSCCPMAAVATSSSPHSRDNTNLMVLGVASPAVSWGRIEVLAGLVPSGGS